MFRLPEELRGALEGALVSSSCKGLKRAREALTADYRAGCSSKRGFQSRADFLAYLATRMPATFGACAAVFQAIKDRCPQFVCRSMLDLGAGPGTASWAAVEMFPELRELHLVEREKVAIEAGKDLSAHSMHEAWKRASWNEASLESLSDIPQVDLAVLSYAVAELPKDVVNALLQRLWERNISLVAVIEPGTPQGFARIRTLRERAIEQGARIVAPCPHGFACPMPVNDWCHFSTRIERTRLHRQLKEGSLGYEDEKYSYVVYGQFATLAPMRGRVLRHPQKGSGFVKLSVCEADGAIREETITRSNKDQYRLARDAEWGSSLA